LVYFWDTTTHSALGEPLNNRQAEVVSIAFSPDGKTLATSSWNNSVHLWDVTTHALVGPPLGVHVRQVLSVAFSPDGRTLASASNDHKISLWDGYAGREFQPPGDYLPDATCAPATIPNRPGEICSVALSPNGETLATGFDDGTVMLWDTSNRQSRCTTLKEHTEAVRSLAFSPDGTMLASGSNDHSVIRWDVASCEMLGAPLEQHTEDVLSVAFTSDPDKPILLVSGSADKKVILWNVEGNLLAVFEGHTNAVQAVAISPDGKLIASGDWDNKVLLWDVRIPQSDATPSPSASPQPFTSLGEQGREIYSLAFSPDGGTLASASGDGSIVMWDVATRKQRGIPLRGHTNAVMSVAFSPDGNTLASGSWDQTIILWDVKTRQSLGSPLTGQDREVYAVGFSNASGGRFFFQSDTVTIIAWDTEIEKWRARACSRANRNLAEAEWEQYFDQDSDEQPPYRSTCPDLPPGNTTATGTPQASPGTSSA
jgi:WD40 repeat protein